MNKIYKVVWSDAKGCYVVASEFAKQEKKGPSSGRQMVAAVAVASVLATGAMGSGVASAELNNLKDDPSVEGAVVSSNRTAAVTVGKYSLSLDNSTASGEYAVALGKNTEAVGVYSFAAGSLTKASGKYSVALGNGSKATAESAVAMGKGSEANGAYSVALGDAVKANGISSIAMGAQSVAGDNYAIALGDNTKASESSSIAMGNGAEAQKNYSVAIGGNAKAMVDSGIALGQGSEATIEGGVAGYDPDPNDSSRTIGSSTDSALAIGTSDGSVSRQIIGVAAGTNDTDAVNVAQLKKASLITDGGHNYYDGSDTNITVKDALSNVDAAIGAVDSKESYNYLSPYDPTTKDNTISDNLIALDKAMTLPDKKDGEAITYNVITKSTTSGGKTVTTPIGDNIVAIDQKIGSITGDTKYVKNGNTISENLTELDKQIQNIDSSQLKEVIAGDNIDVKTADQKATVSLKDDIKVNSVSGNNTDSVLTLKSSTATDNSSSIRLANGSITVGTGAYDSTKNKYAENVKISGVANGALTNASTDAVNGSQLMMTDDNKTAGTTANYINYKKSTDSAPVTVIDAVNALDTKIGKVDDSALSPKYNTASKTTTGSKTLENSITGISIDGNGKLDGSVSNNISKLDVAVNNLNSGKQDKLTAGKNISENELNNNKTIALEDDISVGSITGDNNGLALKSSTNSGASTITLQDSGVKVTGKLTASNGLDVNKNKITNVEAGTEDTDAVNVSQLKESGDYSTIITGDHNYYGTAPTSKTKVTDAVNAVDAAIGDPQVAGTYVSAYDAGNGTGATVTDNITALDNAIGNVTGAEGTDIHYIKDSLTSSGETTTLKTTVADNLKNLDKAVWANRLSNLKAGNNISIDSVDTKTDNPVTTVSLKDDITVNSVKGSKGSLTLNSSDGGSSLTLDKNGITVTNGSGTAQIHGVEAGTAKTDAVNVGQLQSGGDYSLYINDKHKYYDGTTNAVKVTDAVNAVDKAVGIVSGKDKDGNDITYNYIHAYNKDDADNTSIAADVIALDNAIGNVPGKITTDPDDPTKQYYTVTVNGDTYNYTTEDGNKYKLDGSVTGVTIDGNGKIDGSISENISKLDVAVNNVAQSKIGNIYGDGKVTINGTTLDKQEVQIGSDKYDVSADNGNIKVTTGKLNGTGEMTTLVELNKDITVNSVSGTSEGGLALKANSSDSEHYLTIGSTGTSINGGLDVENSKITGVLAGTDATDAVNVGQLQTGGDYSLYIEGAHNNFGSAGTSTKVTEAVVAVDKALGAPQTENGNVISALSDDGTAGTVTQNIAALDEKIGTVDTDEVDVTKLKTIKVDGNNVVEGSISNNLAKLDVEIQNNSLDNIQGDGNISVDTDTDTATGKKTTTVSLNKDIEVSSVTGKDGGSLALNSGNYSLTIDGTDGITVANGDKDAQIHGVAAGDLNVDTDAVNVGQLKSYVGDETTIKDAHNNYDGTTTPVKVTEAVNAVDAALGAPQTENGNVISAYTKTTDPETGVVTYTGTATQNIEALDTAIGKLDPDAKYEYVNTVNNIYQNIGSLDIAIQDVAANQTKVEAGDTNIVVSTPTETGEKNTYKVSLSNTITAADADQGITIQSNNGASAINVNDNGTTVYGPLTAFNGLDVNDAKITNVAAGEDDTDAVNFGQLKEAGDKYITIKGPHNNFANDGTATAATETPINDAVVAIDDGLGEKQKDTGDLNVISAYSKTTNPDGSATYTGTATQNIKALDEAIGTTKDGKYIKSDESVGDNLGHLDDALANFHSDAKAYTDDEVAKVGARAAAMASLHPLDSDSDTKLSVAAGVGGYHGRGAVAIGGFYKPDDRTMLNLSIATGVGTETPGDTMIGLGATFALDKNPKHYTPKRKEMAEKIEQLERANAELKEQLIHMKGLLEEMVSSLQG